MHQVPPVAEPIPAVLAGGSASLKHHKFGAAHSPWGLILCVALPYWVVVSTVQIVGSELYNSVGAGSAYDRALGYLPGVRVVHYVLMLLVVMLAYRAALAVGWPGENRWVAIIKHAVIAFIVAFVSRPVFVVAMEVVSNPDINWHLVFFPPAAGLRLWTSLGLWFLLPYVLGLALLAGVRIRGALRRSEIERVNLHNAWTQARLQAMRMQLNPHFLFNAFNSIATLLDANPDPARARALLLALSDLYRRTLIASERDWMSVREELSLADDYLRIQAARFDGRLTHEIACDEGLAETQLPALLLQPLVENAVVHGTANSLDELRIWIDIHPLATPDGASTAVIEVGNESTGTLGGTPGAGAGLRITRTRLDACYGGRARVDARSTASGSFLVRIDVPLVAAR